MTQHALGELAGLLEPGSRYARLPSSWKYDVISEIRLVNRCAFTWRTILHVACLERRLEETMTVRSLAMYVDCQNVTSLLFICFILTA